MRGLILFLIVVLLLVLIGAGGLFIKNQISPQPQAVATAAPVVAAQPPMAGVPSGFVACSDGSLQPVARGCAVPTVAQMMIIPTATQVPQPTARPTDAPTATPQPAPTAIPANTPVPATMPPAGNPTVQALNMSGGVVAVAPGSSVPAGTIVVYRHAVRSNKTVDVSAKTLTQETAAFNHPDEEVAMWYGYGSVSNARANACREAQGDRTNPNFPGYVVTFEGGAVPQQC